MKRFLMLSMLLTLLFVMGNAASAQADAVPEQEAHRYTQHTIGISGSGIAFRNELFAASNVFGTTKEQQVERYKKALETYAKRPAQQFPKLETIHEVTPYRGREDVFSLEAEHYERIVFYIHGGAWVQEISEAQVTFCDKIADTLKAKVVIPLYPLAPQAGYEETYAMLDEVYDLVAAEGKPVVVMGDSVGGTCSLGLVLSRKAKNKTLPEKVVALAPCADLTLSNPEIDELEKLDGMVPRYFCRECAKLWTNGACLTDASLSPMNGDFAGFPDTMLIVGDHDIVYGDTLRLIEKLREAGVRVTFLKGEGFWHVFPIFDIREAGACRELIRVFVEE